MKTKITTSLITSQLSEVTWTSQNISSYNLLHKTGEQSDQMGLFWHKSNN